MNACGMGKAMLHALSLAQLPKPDHTYYYDYEFNIAIENWNIGRR